MTTLDRRQVLLATGMALAATATPRWAHAAQAQVDPTRLDVDFTGGSPRGALASALRGVPRLDLEEGTGLPVGARIEGLGRNHAWSTAMQGAAPGVIGADGSLPDGWRLQAPRGISVSIATVTAETIELLVQGTAVQDGAVSIAFTPEEGAPATAGQPWTGSVECQVEEQAQGVRAYEIWIDDPGGLRAAQAFTPQPDTLWPIEIQHDVAVAGGLSHGVDIQLAAGSAVTASIRLRRPQLEPGGQRSSFIPSQRGDGRRAPDRLTISRADTRAGAEAWAATVIFRPGARPSGTIREWTSADGRRLTLFLLNYLVRLEEGSGEAVSRTLSLGRVCRFGASCVAVSVGGGCRLRSTQRGRGRERGRGFFRRRDRSARFGRTWPVGRVDRRGGAIREGARRF